ncbi:MAG: alpha/beta hydrolase-fold protein, partial [Bacteroidales bacterium]
MKTWPLFMIAVLLKGFMIPVNSQEKTYALNFSISVNKHVRPSFKSQGRLFVTLSTIKEGEPKDQVWPNSISGRHYLFAKNFTDWDPSEPLIIQDTAGWSTWGRTDNCSFNAIPEDTYYIQFLWQQNFHGFGNKEEGNIFSKKQELVLDKKQTLEISLSEVVEESGLMDHPLMKMVHYRSDILSKWWGRPVQERAAVLLPSGYYDNPEREYPVFYYIGGGDSNCKNTLNMRWNRFSDAEWWMSDDAPQVIVVFLDGTMNSNIYHLDSDNLGPHGHSLIYEFIPHIEKMYRGTDSPDTRYIGGCSTGGYGSLALQLFYPEAFNGVYCYSPDPISFARLMNVNIYKNSNYFFDIYGYPRLAKEPGTSGIPISWKDWLEFENVLGYSGTYLDSDHWLGVMSAIFGPKGADGKPVPLIDPVTGDI